MNVQLHMIRSAFRGRALPGSALIALPLVRTVAAAGFLLLAGAAAGQDQAGQPVVTPEAKPQMLIAKPQVSPLIPRPKPAPNVIEADRQPANGAGQTANGSTAATTDDEACQWRLRALGVAFEPLPQADIDPKCDGKALLVIRELSPEISVEPEAVLTCDMVEALAGWMQDVVLVAAAKHLMAQPTGIVHQPARACHQSIIAEPAAGATEPGRRPGNAIHLSAITFEAREPMTLRARDRQTGPGRTFQRVIRIGACRFFPTVQGPGSEPSDASGPQRLYLDLADRPNGGRICH